MAGRSRNVNLPSRARHDPKPPQRPVPTKVKVLLPRAIRTDNSGMARACAWTESRNDWLQNNLLRNGGFQDGLCYPHPAVT
jgi:hypothetical protein